MFKFIRNLKATLFPKKSQLANDEYLDDIVKVYQHWLLYQSSETIKNKTKLEKLLQGIVDV